MSNPMSETPNPFSDSDIEQTISTPNKINDEISSLPKEEEEDTTFDDFFETVKGNVENLHKVSGGVDEVIPSPNMGNLFDPQDEVMSRIFIGAAILAALRRNTLFSVSGPSAILMAMFYPIIYLAMVFTDMFLFGNVKFEGE